MYLATTSPSATPEYLNWSEQDISFDREDHPPQVPRPGHSPLVLEAQIGGFDMSKVFMDGGSGLNLIFATTLRAMNISLTNLKATDTSFHGIVPGRPEVPLGKIGLDIIFGTQETIGGKESSSKWWIGRRSTTPSLVDRLLRAFHGRPTLRVSHDQDAWAPRNHRRPRKLHSIRQWR